MEVFNNVKDALNALILAFCFPSWKYLTNSGEEENCSIKVREMFQSLVKFSIPLSFEVRKSGMD